MPARSTVVSILLTSLVIVGALRGEPPSTPAPAGSKDQLQEWVAALGAREFETRDQAMQSLIAAGQAAIEPALKVTRRGDSEVATRAVMILRGIGERGDIATLEAVLAALTQVTETAAAPVVQRATEVRERLESVRQDRAIDYFRQLGAEVSPEYSDNWISLFFPPLFSIEFGPDWKGTEKDLERLKWLRDAQQVVLIGDQVRDSWFPYLREMPLLMSVKIKRAPITTQALESLAQLDRLRALRLQFVPLGDEMVPHLEKCESLIRLVVISQKLSAEGEQRLKQRFQDGVECPKGAMLGVRAGLEEPWSIREVVPGSAAEKAGLRPHDRIVKYNGQPVETFLELKDMISRSQPGETATVEVERDTERLEMKIVFGEWD